MFGCYRRKYEWLYWKTSYHRYKLKNQEFEKQNCISSNVLGKEKGGSKSLNLTQRLNTLLLRLDATEFKSSCHPAKGLNF